MCYLLKFAEAYLCARVPMLSHLHLSHMVPTNLGLVEFSGSYSALLEVLDTLGSCLELDGCFQLARYNMIVVS